MTAFRVGVVLGTFGAMVLLCFGPVGLAAAAALFMAWDVTR